MAKNSKKEKSFSEIVVTKEEFLKLRPYINPLVEQKKKNEESLLLKIDIGDLKRRKRFGRFLPTPNYKRIQLDKLGMEVFLLCDGKNRVKDIMVKFQEKFKLTQTETEVSVQNFLMSLTQRHIIGFLIPKEIGEKHQIGESTIEKIIIEVIK
ncbi:MAG: PqqD family protein [Candidatus Hodarchaeota archaeon]